MSKGWDQEFAEEIVNDYNKEFKNRLSIQPRWLITMDTFRVGVCVATGEDADHAKKYFENRCQMYNNNKKKNGHDKNMKENENENENSNDKEEKEIEFMKLHIYAVEFQYEGVSKWCVGMTPEMGGKGNAIDWVASRLHLSSKELKERMILCGDSGNDISMLESLNYQKVIMGNSQSDLRQFYNENKDKYGPNMIMTKQHSTLGVIEGLKHYASQIHPTVNDNDNDHDVDVDMASKRTTGQDDKQKEKAHNANANANQS